MDPRTDLLIAEQRRADFERRAVEYRYARSARRRSRPSLPVRRNTAAHHTVGTAPAACCPA